MGTASFDVPILVLGGEDDGSSSASLRLAMTALNVVCQICSAHTSSSQPTDATHNALSPNQSTELVKPLFGTLVEEFVQTDGAQDDRSRENVHAIDRGEVMVRLF